MEYFDSSGGSFAVEFDGSDTNAPFNGAYTRSSTTVYLNGNQLWRTARFNLSGAHFMNSQNGGADFRLAVSADAFFARRVKVVRPGVPDEAGQVLRGYQANFTAPLAREWVALGPASDLFQPTNDLLRIHSSSKDFRQLQVLLPGASAATQELLARARVTRLAAGDALPGGVAVVADTNNPSGFNYLFRSTAPAGRQMALREASLGWGPQTTFSWATNVWYWLRLRHAPNSLPSLPDVWAKTWRADGLTPEPTGWLLVWDYYPGQPLRTGFAGLVSGADNGGSEMECDFFLLKSDGLPEITVTLPEQKPALASLAAGRPLTSGALPLQLTGEPSRSYQVEASIDLTSWIGLAAVELTKGAAEYLDPAATNFTHRFYRARLWP